MKESFGFSDKCWRLRWSYFLPLFFLLIVFTAGRTQEASAAWTKRVVDGGNDSGSSVRIDSGGYVHIAYLKGGCLIYSNNKTGKWVKKIIDTSGNGGWTVSLAIDGSGKMHISYYDKVKTALKYATNATGSWVKTTVDNSADVGDANSLAVDGGGKVHISYNDYTNYTLKYATNATGSWVKTTIDSSAEVGEYNSIALDGSGKVHISYYDNTHTSLKYATNATGVWVTLWDHKSATN
jgi:hypothetical protein